MSSAQSSRAGSVSSSRPTDSHPPSIHSPDAAAKQPPTSPLRDQTSNPFEHTNGSQLTPAAAEQHPSKGPERPSMKTKLTRMFSARDTPKTTPSSTGNTSPQRPETNGSGTPAGNQSDDTKPTRPGPPSRKGSRDNHVEKVNGKEKKETTRFTLDPELPGGHGHHLRAARRQEKLSDLWRLFTGKKQEKEKEPDHGENLSLFYNWIDAVKAENRRQAVNAESKDGQNQHASLVQKYGKCQEVVGRGAFGVVRISHKKVENGQERLFAVKEFRRRPEETEKRYSKRLTAEFCISSSLRHPNVIHTLDLLKDAKGDFCEVMEFCAGGDLFTLVLAAGKLEVQEADCFFKQMMRGVQYLHEMGVAHRDLKPENLLLTTRGGVKITDFGNGECFRMAWETDAHMVTGLCGSAPYIAPEEYTDKEFDARAVDVWACGVIYMAMRTGRHLWRTARSDQDEFYARYLVGRKDDAGFAPIESLHRARCRNVVYSILNPNPNRRLTAAEVLKSEWGREIQVCHAGEEGL